MDTNFSVSVYDKIDHLLNRIDAFTSSSQLIPSNIRDKYARNQLQKTFIQTPLGNGHIVDESNAHYTIDLGSMIASFAKSVCTLDHSAGSLILTPLGKGIVIDSTPSAYTIEMDEMVSSLLKSQCVLNDKTSNADESKQAQETVVLSGMTAVREIAATDLQRVAQLEHASYPEDEAATTQKLYYRFIFARRYFKVFTLNNTVIGFVCGTKTPDAKLTHESMSVHSAEGKHLCIHSVVIDSNYRRHGYGRKMFKSYIKQCLVAEPSLLSIRLCCKKHLIAFYGQCGFKLIGESDLDHGKDTWYDMVIDNLS
mmetsp:Transcript_71232/g.113261  ORF Transcript_71232/g.113261 Transcript_71232/m.113261 type:complete len:310 (-) Transcript_71232:42-971(-)